MDRDYFVLTAVGADRPGLVEAVGQFILDHSGNVEASRAATLGGEFAILLLVSCDADNATRLTAELGLFAARSDLSCTCRPTSPPSRKEAVVAGLPYRLTVHSMDHPGIVHAVAHALAALGVNIESLDTHVDSAPHTGTAYFHFHARINLPADMSLPTLRRHMAGLADRLNIDIDLAADEA